MKPHRQKQLRANMRGQLRRMVCLLKVCHRIKAGVVYLAFSLSECLIKSLINPRNVMKMSSTFGTWMKDTAQLNDEQVWVAEHFSGRLEKHCAVRVPPSSYFHLESRSSAGRVLRHYRSIACLQNNTSEMVDVRKFYQGCGHTVHNGSFYYHIAGTSSIARYIGWHFWL